MLELVVVIVVIHSIPLSLTTASRNKFRIWDMKILLTLRLSVLWSFFPYISHTVAIPLGSLPKEAGTLREVFTERGHTTTLSSATPPHDSTIHKDRDGA